MLGTNHGTVSREYRGLTGRMGNAEISDGHVVLGRGGTVAEFEGAVKAPDFGSIMALARKIDPQAADRLRTDSRARERIEGALKDGGQVSLDYDNGVLKIRAGSDLLFSSSATDREMVSSVSGRESIYKDVLYLMQKEGLIKVQRLHICMQITIHQ